jgi:4-amino-4-deoxy-L-arabinose transferase-like glycosyltransferase
VTAQSGRTAWVVAAVLSALFTAFQVQSSFHSGALSLPVTYDDVGYFNDALARLNVLYRDGGGAFLHGFWSSPPHAPLQTLLALVGFGLFGPQRWAADAMNALPLVLLLRLFLGFACRSLPLTTASILAGALLAFPIFGLLVLEFRPDALCAILTATGALTIAADPRWYEGDRKAHAVSSSLFVGAMLAKPTLAPVTVAVYGVAVMSVVMLQSTSKDDARRIARMAAISGGIGVLVVLPYYVAVSRHLYEYITVNAFGSQAGIWARNSATENPAAYYLTGPGGKAAVGTPWLALAGVLIVIGAPTWLRRWRTTAAVCATTLMAYLSVTVVSMKSPFIGLVAPAFILGIIAILACALMWKLPRPLQLLAAVALLVFAAATWRPVSLRLMGGSIPATQAQHFTRIYTQTADALASIPDLGNRRLYFPVIAQYLNQDNLEFELRSRGLPVPTVPMIYFEGNAALQRAILDQSDLAILFSDDSTLPLPWPASSSIRKEINAMVESSGAFELLATVDGGPYRGHVKVLRRK